MKRRSTRPVSYTHLPEKYPYEELQAMAGDINRMSEEIARNMRRLEREKAKIDYLSLIHISSRA